MKRAVVNVFDPALWNEGMKEHERRGRERAAAEGRLRGAHKHRWIVNPLLRRPTFELCIDCGETRDIR